MNKIWAKSISPSFILKDVLEILCRKISIAKREPILPPKNENNKSVNSEILFEPSFALLLSKPKSKKLMKEMVMKYKIIST